MQVWRDVLAEEAQRRIAAAFRHVAENLVVRAVLLDDVDRVAERRRFAHLRGHRVVLGLFAHRPPVGPQRAALVRRGGQLLQSVLIGYGDHAQRAAQQPADVLVARHAAAQRIRGGAIGP